MVFKALILTVLRNKEKGSLDICIDMQLNI